MHIVKYRDCLHSLPSAAKPIEMQFGMLSGVDPGNMYYMEM